MTGRMDSREEVGVEVEVEAEEVEGMERLVLLVGAVGVGVGAMGDLVGGTTVGGTGHVTREWTSKAAEQFSWPVEWRGRCAVL